MLFSRSYMPALLLCFAVAGCSNDGDKCFATARAGLKDPESASLVDWRNVPEANGNMTVVTMRAANSFNAFGHVYGLCYGKQYRITHDESDIGLAGTWSDAAQ